MAISLDQLFSDPKALESIFRGLIGAGTAAAGIQQATTPQTTTVVRGAPAAASPLEQEALGLGFGTLAAGLPGQGITRTPTGLFFQPTGEEQQSALGLNRALASMNARLGGGPLSLQGPTDALSRASLTRKPAFDRSRLISAIQTKMTGPISATSGQGGVLNLERGSDGVFSLPGDDGGGGVFNIPSSFVNLPSSETGAMPGVSSRSGGGGGASSFLPTATGILGAGAGALQVAKALGLIGGGSAGDLTTAKLLASKMGIAPDLAQALINQMPIQKAVDLGLALRGIDLQSPLTIPPGFGNLPVEEFESAFSGLDFAGPGPGSVLGLPGSSAAPFESAFSGLDFAGPGASSAAAEAGGEGVLGNLFASFNPATIPFSVIGGGALAQIMELFNNAVEKKEKLKSKTFANQYFQQIQSDPQAWANQLGTAWGPEGKQLADAALQGKINNWNDILDVLGFPELKGQIEGIGDSTATSAENGDEILPNLSQWATQYIAAPGEQWHGPMLIESNRDKIGRVLEQLKTIGPEGLLEMARRNLMLRTNPDGEIRRVARRDEPDE